MVREAEAASEAAQGDVARQDAIAAVVQAAHAAVTARDAVEARSDPGEGHLLGPPTVSPPQTHLADVTADLAALNAYTSAVDAADAAGHSEAFIKSMVRDYQKLISLEPRHLSRGRQANRSLARWAARVADLVIWCR